jgi:hypothetical protein
MIVMLELPIEESIEIIVEGNRLGIPMVLREPNLFGAVAKWGKVEESETTMTVRAEISAEELAKIPVEYRRG